MTSGIETSVIRSVLHQGKEPRVPRSESSPTLSAQLRAVPPPLLLLALADPLVREQVLARFTRLAGHELRIETSRDPTEALERFATDQCPIVVTDSAELTRRVRAEARDTYTFVLLLTPSTLESARLEALRAGADCCLPQSAVDVELAACLATARRIADLQNLLRTSVTEYRKVSGTDEMTGLASRRYFDSNFVREAERAGRYGRALSLILCDIDHFKRINDTYGHAAGDEVLAQFGSRLSERLRNGTDWVARLGGEEFAVVLPETGATEALAVARKLRAGIASTPFSIQGQLVPLTASFGLSSLEYVGAGTPQAAERLYKVADAALYRSKNAGRNRVTAAALPAAP